MTIYSTSNLPKLLNGAKDDGWRILGAAADVPDGVARGQFSAAPDVAAGTADEDDNDWDLGGDDAVDEEEAGVEVEVDTSDVDSSTENQGQKQQCLDLHKVETGKPTILVLGSEGELVEISILMLTSFGLIYFIEHITPHLLFSYYTDPLFIKAEACVPSWHVHALDS